MASISLSCSAMRFWILWMISFSRRQLKEAGDFIQIQTI